MARVLLVEDDPNIIQSYKMELELSGHEIIPAPDGESGLETAKSQNFDLILLDLSLPKMNGIEVLKELKKDEKTKDVPVIVMSNFATDENVKIVLHLGAKDFVPKYQFTPQETAQKIKQILSPEPSMIESQ